MPKEPNWFYNWVTKNKYYLQDECNYARVRLLAWAAYRKGKREAIAESEKVCEWVRNEAGNIDEWLTTCFHSCQVGHIDLKQSGYVSCPFCTRKIKEISNE